MKGDVATWIELLAGPLLWFGSLGASFAVAPWACSLGWKPPLYAIPIIALSITCATGVMAWTRWRRLGDKDPGETGGAVASSRALVLGAVLLNGMFAIVILAQLVVPSVLGACE